MGTSPPSRGSRGFRLSPPPTVLLQLFAPAPAPAPAPASHHIDPTVCDGGLNCLVDDHVHLKNKFGLLIPAQLRDGKSWRC